MTTVALGRPPDQLWVGIGDLKSGTFPQIKSIVTHALGSCVGVFAYDPEHSRGACLHYLLPKASEGGREPDKFADTGLPRLIKAVAADKDAARRLRLVAAGGASINGAAGDSFRIGPRNVAALKQFLWMYGLVLDAHDFGGDAPRTARLDLRTGQVRIDSGDRSTVL